MDISALRQKLSVYLPIEELAKIDRAYAYSESAHTGQIRASGKPYIVHPLAVADILADWRTDSPSIIAALLHDVVEDTLITLEQIHDTFGSDIAQLVDGLSKIERLHGIDRDVREAENFRKLLLAAAADWRVVFIKLADRLHNMRTLSAISSPAKRRFTASETIDIYAPIAGRLGISKVHDELQNLSFRYLRPHRFRVLTKALKNSGQNVRHVIDTVETTIRNGFQERGVKFRLEKRQKNLYSVYKKMEQNNLTFAQVEDIVGFRLIVDDRAACYQALGILHELFLPIPDRFKDFIAIPKSNGYQSLHTRLLSKGGVKLDVQIRTTAMHRIAENGIAAHWLYKQSEGNLSAIHEEALQRLSSLVRLHAENAAPAEFMENIKIDLFPDEMLVITPKGKIITLPRGATALDMAYAIHTDVGDRADHAIINGAEKLLSSKLKSGDQVEIVTNPKISPLPHWLNWVVTARSRSRIRHVLQTKQERETEKVGRDMLQTAVSRLATIDIDSIDESHWRTVLGGNNFKTREQLYHALAMGEMLPEVISCALLRRRVRRTHGGQIQPVLIVGAGNAAIHLSSCCQPLPVETIVGMLRKERGLIVHSSVCPAISTLKRSSERWVEVQWSNESAQHLYHSTIQLQCRNRPGLISTISSAIGGEQVNIVTCHFDGGNLESNSIALEMIVEVHTLAELENLLAVLIKYPEVLTAERKKEGQTAAAAK